MGQVKEMETIVIRGRGVVPGTAKGTALVFRETIQGWSGLDEATGKVIEKGHPAEGQTIHGVVLVLSGGKGSNGWSSHFHAARVRGIGPCALVLPKIDSRTGVAAAVCGVPTVVDLEEDPFPIIRNGDLVTVDGTSGTVTIQKAS
jgi:predicted aconitase with swiveling domain